jgi:4'-phosphopantetheinyl transferase
VIPSVVRVLPRGTASDDRALLVSAVAELLAIAPAGVTVLRRCESCGGDDHGRPRVAGPAHPPVWVSLSRAGGLVAVVATARGPVGIDIESLERVAAAGFDDVAFSAEERESVRVSADPMLRRARLWTAKEAVLKARGTGLRVDPREVDVEEPADGIRLERVDVPAGYVAAVAYGSISSGSATE